MTGKDLFEALGYIDESFIDDAAHGSLSRPIPWLRIVSAAACLCLLLMCIRPLVLVPQGTVPPTTLPYYAPEGYPEVVVYVHEMTDDGFTGTVAELVIPGLFEIGAELNVVFEENAWFELSDGSCGSIRDRVPDLTGRYVLVLCTEYDPNEARAVANTIWERESPEPTHQKG